MGRVQIGEREGQDGGGVGSEWHSGGGGSAEEAPETITVAVVAAVSRGVAVKISRGGNRNIEYHRRRKIVVEPSNSPQCHRRR